MGNELNASAFSHSLKIYSREFEDILSKITSCYLMLRNDNRTVPLNDENGIRDILVNDYINNAQIKRSIELAYFVLPEVPESNTSGRTDVRIFSPDTFYNQDEYYILECKRLDMKARRGTSGLNSEYIKNGIHRFIINDKYTSYYKTNAMIGFVVESMDIDENVQDINYLLEHNYSHISTQSALAKESFIVDFEFQYSSHHQTDKGDALKLYHLMFDFS